MIARLVSRDSFLFRLGTILAVMVYVGCSLIALGLIARFVWFLLSIGWNGLQ